jgi:hypothetical protein
MVKELAITGLELEAGSWCQCLPDPVFSGWAFLFVFQLGTEFWFCFVLFFPEMMSYKPLRTG